MATPKATELKDLDVERVDGVDKPATGRKFLLAKSEDGAATIMKGYGMLATMADEVLKQLRKDAKAQVSVATAKAINGLAQVLEAAPVFTSKSVPTQPYEFSEPDVNQRGPADEKLGANFSPRSMPGSMVGAVQFREKSAAAVVEAAKGAQIAEDVEAAKAASDVEKKGYKKEDEPEKKPKPGMEEEEMRARGMAKAVGEALAPTLSAIAETLKNVAGGVSKIQKAAEEAGAIEPEVEPAKARPTSKQPVGEEKTAVRKSGDGRLGADFTNIVFPGRS